MDKNPTKEEKISMLRICLDIASCDGGLNSGKIEALNSVVHFLECGQSEVDKAQHMNSATAMLTLQKMDEINRDILIMLLNNVAKGDGPINARENYCINATKMMLNLD